jgi:hypothetical protein
MDHMMQWQIAQVHRRELLELAEVIRPKESGRPPGTFMTAGRLRLVSIVRTLARGIARALAPSSEAALRRRASTFLASRPQRAATDQWATLYRKIVAPSQEDGATKWVSARGGEED